MSEYQFAMWLAGEIKAGMILRTTAVLEYRQRYSVDFMDALLSIDIAIGDWNAGKRYSDVQEDIYV